MRIEWLTHKGKRILFVVFDGTNTEEFAAQVEKYEKVVLAEPNQVLLITDFTKINPMPGSMKVLEESGKRVTRHKAERAAVLGVSGARNLFLTTYLLVTGQKNVKTFNDKDDALEWLVS